MKASDFLILLIFLAAVLGTIWWLLAKGPSASANVSIEGIQVTQAVQTESGHVAPLVAGRSTAVRVLVKSLGSTSHEVRARLYVRADGILLPPFSGVAPSVDPFLAHPAATWANAADTLNFTVEGIPESPAVGFLVKVKLVSTGEELNDKLQLPFITPSAPTLLYTAIDYKPANAGPPATVLTQPNVGDAFVLATFPIDDNAPGAYQEVPGFDWTDDPNGNKVIDHGTAGPEGDVLLLFLANRLNGYSGITNETFLYGWLEGSPMSGGFGYGAVGGRVAYGNTDIERFQRTYAHELGHNYGLDHNGPDQIWVDMPSGVTGWDVRGRLPANPIGNAVDGVLKEEQKNSFMEPGHKTDDAWIHPDTYAYLTNPPSSVSGDPLTDADVPETAERVLVVQGAFDPTGATLELAPAFRYPWPSRPDAVSPTGRYELIVVDDLGDERRTRFDGLVCNDVAITHGFFELRIPIDPDREIGRLVVVEPATSRELAALSAGAPPVLSNLTVVEDLSVPARGTFDVTWDVADSDSGPTELLQQVVYSHDAGATWRPIGTNVRAASVRFHASDVPASQGQGVVRVLVSDGLHTAFADTAGLTIK